MKISDTFTDNAQKLSGCLVQGGVAYPLATRSLRGRSSEGDVAATFKSGRYWPLFVVWKGVLGNGRDTLGMADTSRGCD